MIETKDVFVDADKIGMKIKELREGAGMYQKELGELIGVKLKTVSHWECGERRPNIDMVCRLALCFGVQTDDLLMG